MKSIFKRTPLLISCILFLLFSLVGYLQAQQSILHQLHNPSPDYSLDSQQISYPLKTAFQICQDAHFSLQDLKTQQDPQSLSWVNAEKASLENNKSYWAKITLSNNLLDSLSTEDWRLLFPYLNGRIDYYIVKEEEDFSIEKQGQLLAQQNVQWIHSGYAHSISFQIPHQESRTLYLKCEAVRADSRPFFDTILLPEQEGLSSQNAWFNLLYMGAMLVLCVYNMLFFFIARDKSYIFYSLFLLSNACYTFYVWMRLDTMLHVAMLPDNPATLNFIALIIFPGIISYTLFIQSFINTKFHLPKWHTSLNVLMYLAIPLIALCLYILTTPTIDNKIATLIMAMYIMGSSILGLLIIVPFFKTGDKKVYFFFAGLLLLCTGVFLSAYTFFKFGRTGMFLYCFQTGSIVEVICFSLGLGYKQLMNEREKQKTKTALLKTQLLQEQEHAETIRLQKLNELKARFYTNITHEFRTPLTIILGMTKEIDTGAWTEMVGPKEHSRLLFGFDLIYRNGQKLLRLINQLLDLSKLDSNHLSLVYQTKDIVSFVQYVGESFQSLAESKGVRLSIQSEITALRMPFDEDKLEQIISNLLSNAIKATDASDQVSLQLTQTGSFIQFQVSDTGKGIAAADLPRIFDRFYQVDNKKGEGAGIGLALVKELVALMEGTIVVNSELEQGTSFVVRLPILEEESPSVLPRMAFSKSFFSKNTSNLDSPVAVDNYTPVNLSSKATTDTRYNGLPSLLIIDDNLDIVQYLQAMLAADYTIQIATNGQEGIDQAIAQIPDIIISDVMMPQKDGFEVVATLKQDKRTSHIPIILLTAKATQADKVAGLKHGADAYLMKPFNKEELFARLENLVALRKDLQNRYSKVNTQ